MVKRCCKLQPYDEMQKVRALSSLLACLERIQFASERDAEKTKLHLNQDQNTTRKTILISETTFTRERTIQVSEKAVTRPALENGILKAIARRRSCPSYSS